MEDWIYYYFTFELVFRLLIFSPNPKYNKQQRSTFRQWVRFVFHPWQLLDFFSILPFFLEFVVNDMSSFKIFRVLRLVRVFQVVKLGKSSSTARTLMKVLYKSSETVFLLLLILAFGMFLFGE